MLIDRYKNLIFSIPIKFGLIPRRFRDVFQAVCADLVAGLPRLREPRRFEMVDADDLPSNACAGEGAHGLMERCRPKMDRQAESC